MNSLFQSIPALALIFTFNLTWSLNCVGQIENLYRVTTKQKVENSSIIAFGEIVSQKSFWNEEHTLILTSNVLEISSLIKGSSKTKEITILTQGGRVGDTMITTSSLISFEIGDKGIFFCDKEKNSSSYKIYSSKQGFLKYHQQEHILSTAFYEVTEDEFIQETSKLLKVKLEKETVFDSNLNKQLQAGGSICFSPSFISAGTGSVLEITGVGFGTSGASTTDFVEFSSADDGGSPFFVQPPLVNYTTWNDTLIRVVVPTKAGTGPVRVSIGGVTQTSIDDLTVTFAILNNSDGTVSYLGNQNGFGGRTWTFNSALFGGNEQPPFTRALDTWKCATGINWTISSTSTLATGPSADGINTVFVGFLPIGVLGICYTASTNCSGVNWNVIDQDIGFSSQVSWNYGTGLPSSSQFDFESVAVHELGHAHLLGHVIDAGADVMHYALGNGATQRTLGPYNIIAGDYVLDIATQQDPCSVGLQTLSFPSGCLPGSSTDISIQYVGDVLDDSTCFGLSETAVYFQNLGGVEVNQIDFGWSVNGTQQPPVSWSGTLMLDQYVDFFGIGNYDFQDSLYEVLIWVESVNGTNDMVQDNDSLLLVFHPVSCTPDDAAAIAISQFQDNVCYDTVPVEVSIQNTGSNNLTTCWVYIEYQGILIDSILWTGNLLPGDTSNNFLITSITNIQESNQLRFWTELPNGVSDTYLANDTLEYQFNSFRLSGTYTVGGSSPDFTSIQSALDRLNNYGICGDVIINIRDGIYQEDLYIDDVASSDSSYKIIVQSENQDASLVTLKNVNSVINEAILSLDSTRNISIRHLTFLSTCEAQNTATRGVVEITRGAKNITFEENVIYFDTAFYSSAHILIDAVWGSRKSDTIIIRNNTMLGGRFGVRVSYSLSESGFANYLRIIGNEIHSDLQAVLTIGKYENIEVSDNEIYQDSASNIVQSSLISYSGDSLNFHHNKLVNKSNSTTLSIEGTSASPSTPVRVYNNSILQIRPTTGLLTTTVNLWAPNVELYFNTISLIGGLGSQYNRLLYLAGDSSKVKSNILHSGVGSEIYELGVNNLVCDNNNYWTTGSMETGVSSLASFVSTHNVDYNSTFVSPVFPNLDTLVPYNTWDLDNLGSPEPYIFDDIFYNVRDAVTPDAGAFEFSIDFSQILDLSIDSVSPSGVCFISDSVFTTFSNNSNDTLNSTTISWSVNGGSSNTYNWTGILLPGQSETVFLGLGTFLTGTSNSINVQINGFNGSTDVYTQNNSASSTYTLNELSILTSTNVLCTGNTLNLQSSLIDASNSYSWSTTEVSYNTDISSGGTYWLEVVDSNSCVYMDSITILEFTPIPIGIQATGNNFCVGDSIQLVASPQLNGNSYQWNWQNSTASEIFVTSSFLISLVTLDSNGCQSYDSLTVSEYPFVPVAIQTPSTTFCAGDSIELSAFPLVFGDSYSWSWQNSTDSSITVNQPGNHTLTVIDTYGCEQSTSITLVENPLPDSQLNVTQDSLLSANSGVGNSYQWFFNNQPISGATGSQYEAELIGDYYFVVENLYGCVDTSVIYTYLGNDSGLGEMEIINLSIYPNPSSEVLFLSDEIEGVYDYSIIDASGRLIKEELKVSGNTVSISKLAEGVYFLLIKNESKLYKSRFCKIKAL